MYGAGVFFLVASFRMIVASFLRTLLRKGHGANNLLVLGATDAGKKIAQAFAKAPERGKREQGLSHRQRTGKERQAAGRQTFCEEKRGGTDLAADRSAVRREAHGVSRGYDSAI